MLLAFGSLVAAGLPLMLTMVGLLAAAGSLYLGTLIMPISIWAMNFALMFALALGIDYALFIVMRFRGAFFGSKLDAQEATAVTMDTAGKAVLFSGVTVLISLTAVMLVPSPAFRSMSLGIMLAVIFVLARHAHPAARGARQARPQGRQPVAAVGALARRASLGALCRLGRAPVAPPARATASPRSSCCSRSPYPVTQLKTSMPSIKVVPVGDSSRVGYNQVQAAMGPGATGPLQIVAPASRRRRGRPDRSQRSRHRPGHASAGRRPRACPGHRDPAPGPLKPRGRSHDRAPARTSCPPVPCSAARSPKTTTCRRCCRPRRHW